MAQSTSSEINSKLVEYFNEMLSIKNAALIEYNQEYKNAIYKKQKQDYSNI